MVSDNLFLKYTPTKDFKSLVDVGYEALIVMVYRDIVNAQRYVFFITGREHTTSHIPLK